MLEMKDMVQAHKARLLAVHEVKRKAAGAYLLFPFRMLAINVAGNSSANVPIIRSKTIASRQLMPYSLIQYVTKNYHPLCFTVPRAFCLLSIPNADVFLFSQAAWEKLDQTIYKWQLVLVLVQDVHALS